jgi:hypothetical protein
MPKQKRYNSEEQIVALIDRAHQLEAKDIQEIHGHKMEIVKLRPYEDQLPAINYHKGQIETLEKRVKGRATRLQRMKEKLAEFRTLTFPGMEEIMTPNTITR